MTDLRFFRSSALFQRLPLEHEILDEENKMT